LNLLFLGNLFCAAIRIIPTGKGIISIAMRTGTVSITGAYSAAFMCCILIFIAEVFSAFSSEIGLPPVFVPTSELVKTVSWHPHSFIGLATW
jgi:hypothetical protein